MLRYWQYEPDLGGDSDYEPTTADVIARQDALYSGPGGALRSLRDQIPESPNTLSILNMGRSGLNTMANWLQNSPEIGPDTLAPLGMAGAGMAMAPAHSLGSAGGKLSHSLPMDEAARLQRAREMGFDTDAKWYHGTSRAFDEFTPEAYFSPSQNRAQLYMDMSAPRVQRAERLTGRKLADPRVEETYIRPGRQQTIDMSVTSNQENIANLLAKAKEDGYETVRLKEHRDLPENGKYLDELVVFDPKNIRRTKAAFDPSQSHSANLLAADNAKSSLPGTIVNSIEQDDGGWLNRLLRLRSE